MNILLGSSPLTSMLGYMVILVGVVQTGIAEQGFPHDTAGWLKLGGYVLTGIALRFSKDANVSNAPTPNTTATPVVPK